MTHTIAAALLGQGIALGRSLLVKDHLRDGRLVRLFDIDAPGTYSYYLTWRRENPREVLRNVFRDWIVGQFRPPASQLVSGD